MELLHRRVLASILLTWFPLLLLSAVGSSVGKVSVNGGKQKCATRRMPSWRLTTTRAKRELRAVALGRKREVAVFWSFGGRSPSAALALS